MDAYQKVVADMSNLPIALRPVYIGDPNKPIVLCEGSLELQQTFTIDQEIKEHIETGKGHVVFTWFPLPCIKFEFANNHQEFFLDLNQSIYLRISELKVLVSIRLSNFYSGGKTGNNVSGRITEPIVQGSGQDVSYVIFHVVNFQSYDGSWVNAEGTPNKFMGRVNFEITESNWKLTLDKLENISEKIKVLKADGGFSITHIGKLERLDGTVFSGDEAREFISVLQNFLSFARGLKVPIILLSGYDAHSEKIWEYWDLSYGDSWQGVSSLLPELNGEGQFLADVFPGFLRWWQDENWKKSVKLILHCYLEANIGSGGAEGSIILEQTALELIAYILGNSTGRAADKIRKILTKFGVSINLPPGNDIKRSPSDENSYTQALQALEKYSSPPSIPILENLRYAMEAKNSRAEKEDQKWEDAPRALTEIRNDIVHAKKDLNFLDETQTSKARRDASDLGLWYLDVVLLNLFGYKGNYINRLNGNTEPLPGANIDNFAENQYGTQHTTQIQPNLSQPPEPPQ
jgi:hypothetical protein